MPQCKTNSRCTEPAKEQLAQQHPEMEKIAFADDPKSYADVAAKIGKTPVWIFHGGDDPVVPVDGSRKLNEAIEAAGRQCLLTS